MISRQAILRLMELGLIKVIPEPVKIGPNSIDLRLGDSLKMYHPTEGRVVVIDEVTQAHYKAIDPKNPPPLIDVPKVTRATAFGSQLWDQGYQFNNHWLLVPGQFYLGSTMEETYCKGVVPHLDGRSTCGRLSIEAHKTAGLGDNGFHGRWTLEIEVTEPVLVKPGDRLFQLYFTPAWGKGLAHVIGSIFNNEFIRFLGQGQNHLGFDLGSEPVEVDPGRIIELEDLYGSDDGHHYQGSEDVKGPSPLD